jgi:hypothetical protein
MVIFIVVITTALIILVKLLLIVLVLHVLSLLFIRFGVLLLVLLTHHLFSMHTEHLNDINKQLQPFCLVGLCPRCDEAAHTLHHRGLYNDEFNIMVVELW